MQYLSDTNIFIRAAKGYAPEAQFLSKAIRKGQLTISTIVAAEFLAKANVLEKQAFEGLLSKFTVLGIDLEVAKMAAEYRRKSLKQKRVHLLDCFLAAQAKLNHLILVTNNKTDFPMKDIIIKKV